MQHHAIAVHDADDSHVVERDHPPDRSGDAREDFLELERLGGDLGDLGEYGGDALGVDGGDFLEGRGHGHLSMPAGRCGTDQIPAGTGG